MVRFRPGDCLPLRRDHRGNAFRGSAHRGPLRFPAGAGGDGLPPVNLAQAAEVNLRWLLQPISELLCDPALTDLHINGPGSAWVDRGRGMEHLELPFTMADLEDIAVNAAALTRQDIAEDAPLVSTRLPDGHRVQIVRPPAVADGQFAFSIRQPKADTWTPAQLAAKGVFAR